MMMIPAELMVSAGTRGEPDTLLCVEKNTGSIGLCYAVWEVKIVNLVLIIK